MIWIPPLLVGAAAATAVGTGAAVLLYDSQGLPRAVVVLGGVIALSGVAGLWMGAVGETDESLPTAAKWWMGLLVALLAGAAFSALWEWMDGFGRVPVSQGLGLAFTGALPAYFAGGVLGRIGSFAGSLGGGVRRHVVIGAALGTVAGAALVEALLGRPVLAVTAFLAATVFASGGARFQGWIFDRVPRLRTVLREAARPELRFERWRTAVPGVVVRVLRDGGRERAVDPPAGGDWRWGVAATLDPAGAVLFVGAGAWFAREGGGEWRVHEPDADVGRMAGEGFGWPAGSLSESPVPERPGCTVIADWESVGDALVNSFTIPELLAAFRTAEVERVWIGSRPGGLPPELAGMGAEAGFAVTRYSATAAGRAGPPRLESRRRDVWCLDLAGGSPGPVFGMTLFGLDGRLADSGGG